MLRSSDLAKSHNHHIHSITRTQRFKKINIYYKPVTHGESRATQNSLDHVGPGGSTSHIVNNWPSQYSQHSQVKTKGASCIGGLSQTDGLGKFKLGMLKSQGVSCIGAASGITDLTVVWASYQIRKIAGCACAGNAGNVFPRRRFQRKHAS